MKIYILDGKQTVLVEHLDNQAHTHDFEESFRLKKPTILLDFLKAEAAKYYAASHIYRAFREDTLEGSTRLEQNVGAFLKRQAKYWHKVLFKFWWYDY